MCLCVCARKLEEYICMYIYTHNYIYKNIYNNPHIIAPLIMLISLTVSKLHTQNSPSSSSSSEKEKETFSHFRTEDDSVRAAGIEFLTT